MKIIILKTKYYNKHKLGEMVHLCTGSSYYLFQNGKKQCITEDIIIVMKLSNIKLYQYAKTDIFRLNCFELIVID